jgi:hypothetical protein
LQKATRWPERDRSYESTALKQTKTNRGKPVMTLRFCKQKTVRIASKAAARTQAAAWLLGLLALATSLPAQALEVTAGDYEIYPAGINIGLLYFQHYRTSDLYVNGSKAVSDFSIRPTLGLARYIRPIRLTDTLTLDAQAILPFGQIKTRDNASVLGSTSGTADLILGAPIKFLLDSTTRDALSFGPFVYLPTGSYDNTKSLNLGENRWKGLFQLAYVKHFGKTWALDTVGDVLIHGKNKEFGAAEATLKQDPRYEVQTHLRYILSPATALSAGLGHYRGGETKINGVDQNDRLRTTYGRLTAAHFVDKTTQLQIQLGRDLSVYNGAKENARINLRLAKIF